MVRIWDLFVTMHKLDPRFDEEVSIVNFRTCQWIGLREDLQERLWNFYWKSMVSGEDVSRENQSIDWLVVSNIWSIYFIYGMSSFPVTNSYFSRWLLHYQPDRNKYHKQ